MTDLKCLFVAPKGTDNHDVSGACAKDWQYGGRLGLDNAGPAPILCPPSFVYTN
jgi:hypothetical protein